VPNSYLTYQDANLWKVYDDNKLFYDATECSLLYEVKTSICDYLNKKPKNIWAEYNMTPQNKNVLLVGVTNDKVTKSDAIRTVHELIVKTNGKNIPCFGLIQKTFFNIGDAAQRLC
jgi:hypothetical protein